MLKAFNVGNSTMERISLFISTPQIIVGFPVVIPHSGMSFSGTQFTSFYAFSAYCQYIITFVYYTYVFFVSYVFNSFFKKKQSGA